MSFHQDVHYGIRTMVRAPVSTAVAVLSLALGIGAATTVFTLINGLMFRPSRAITSGTARPSAGSSRLKGSATMAAVALVGAYVPARRAARVEPMVVLREE